MAIRLATELQGTTALSGLGGIPGNRTPHVLDSGGKQQIIYGSFVTAASQVAGAAGIFMDVGSVALLAPLPPRFRVLKGRLSFGLMGGTASASLGIYRRVRAGMVEAGQGSGVFIVEGSATRWANAISVVSAGEADFAHTAALNIGEYVQIDPALGPLYLGVSAGGSNWAAGQAFKCLFEVAVA